MLRINAEPTFFTEVFTELKEVGANIEYRNWSAPQDYVRETIKKSEKNYFSHVGNNISYSLKPFLVEMNNERVRDSYIFIN